MNGPFIGNREGRLKMLAIVGPTCVGKTHAALAVASPLDAEVVSVDSMQVYRGMDIGTSKPIHEDRAKVRFYMIDVVDPDAGFSVAQFKAMADRAITDIADRKKVPLLVGGSGLYYRAVVDDLDFSNTGDPGMFRVEMEEELSDMTNFELHDLLGALDKRAAAEIPPSNRRRVLKAIEIARIGDRPVSERQSSWSDYESPYDLSAVGLAMDRELLYHLIDNRVDAMIEAGLVDEVAALYRGGLRRGTTCGDALGYRQIVAYLEGELTLDESVQQIKTRTRNYARRQLTWFGKDPRIKWFQIAGKPGDSPERLERASSDTAALVLEYLTDKLEN